MRNHRILPTLPAIAATILLGGCFTTSVVHRGLKQNHRFARFILIERAAVDDDTVYVEVAARRHGARRVERFVVELPAGDPEGWRRAADGKPRTPRPLAQKGIDLWHLPLHALKPPGSIPPHAVAVPVVPIRLEDLRRPESAFAPLAPGIHVFSVSYRYQKENLDSSYVYGDAEPPSGPLLAVLRARADAEPLQLLVFADVHEGSSRQGVLLLLIPAAVALDAVTFPVQLVGMAIGG